MSSRSSFHMLSPPISNWDDYEYDGNSETSSTPNLPIPMTLPELEGFCLQQDTIISTQNGIISNREHEMNSLVHHLNNLTHPITNQADEITHLKTLLTTTEASTVAQRHIISCCRDNIRDLGVLVSNKDESIATLNAQIAEMGRKLYQAGDAAEGGMPLGPISPLQLPSPAVTFSSLSPTTSARHQLPSTLPSPLLPTFTPISHPTTDVLPASPLITFTPLSTPPRHHHPSALPSASPLIIFTHTLSPSSLRIRHPRTRPFRPHPSIYSRNSSIPQPPKRRRSSLLSCETPNPIETPRTTQTHGRTLHLSKRARYGESEGGRSRYRAMPGDLAVVEEGKMKEEGDGDGSGTGAEEEDEQKSGDKREQGEGKDEEMAEQLPEMFERAMEGVEIGGLRSGLRFRLDCASL